MKKNRIAQLLAVVLCAMLLLTSVGCKTATPAETPEEQPAATEAPAVADDAADADTAEADAMIAALAPDQPRARPLSPRALDGERDLERRVHRFGPAVGEEYPVEPIRHQRRDPPRQCFMRQQ